MSSLTDARCWRVSQPPSLSGCATRSSRRGHIAHILLTPLSANRGKLVCKFSTTRGLNVNQLSRQQSSLSTLGAPAALASSLPAVTERTIALPIDFYQVLGADTHFLADAVLRAYEAKLNNLPAEGFSEDAIAARQEILRGAYETLADPDLRGEYNDSLIEDEAGTVMVDVPFSKVPGALCLLQEAGEMEIVLQVGKNLLEERLIRNYQRDVILAMALAYVELSREAMAETTPKIMRSCDLLEKSLKLLQEEGGSTLAPSLQQQIDHTIQHLNPRCLLELLALPLEKEHEGRRQEGKQGIQAILWTVGDGGAFLPIPGFTREAYLKEAFSCLIASEQVDFFTTTPSNIPAETSEVYAVALAHIAEGFVSKKPLMIQEADTLFLELQQANSAPSNLSGDYRPADQKLEFTFERGMCALLLGEIDDCRAWLGLDDTNSPYRDQSVAEFIIANSSEGEDIDYLPGLCKLLESWMGVVVFPNFRELRESRVHLRDYFDDPNVLSYLEKLEKGGSPLAAAAAIAQLGAGAGAALDSVKASALETLQKVFPIGKGKGGPRINSTGYSAHQSDPPQSGNMPIKGIEEEVEMDTTLERSSWIKTASSGVAWSEGEKPRRAENQQFSPLRMAGASVLMGVLVLGGWRAFYTGKGLLKSQTNHSEEQMTNAPGSAASSLAQKNVPQIDAQIAEKIVRRWQAVKSQALGRDHAVKSLSEVLDGQMLENMNGRAKDAQKNGWYWEYKLTDLNIDSVTISTDGRRATVEATLWEGANLYDEKTAQVLDSYQSSYTIRYELATTNNRWKITSGTVLRS